MSLLDAHGRRHTNLRVSVTDRCNLRCVYCMPEDATFRPKDELLTFEEIARLVRIGAGLGIDKVRLTGGEPTLRQELPTLVALLAAVPGIVDLGMTTNGILLDRLAAPLRQAGLRRLNVSLDTLDRAEFTQLARRDLLEPTLAGLRAARAAGFQPIKVNAIALAGPRAAARVVELARFCRAEGHELRLIEFMPLEADGIWDRTKVFAAADILQALAEAGMPADPTPPADPHAPAEDYLYRDGGGRLGIVASVTRPFCGNCNRLRLTAEGKLRNCLFSLQETDLRQPLRSGATDADLADLFRSCVAGKWAGHLINQPSFLRPERTMHAIGG